jgi:hypothetical protein
MRDWDVLDSIISTLQGTGSFDGVYPAAEPEQQGKPADDRLAAVVAPRDWEEVDDSDDPTTVQSTRRIRYGLVLIARDADAEARARALDQLLAVAQNALDGQSIGGLTIAGWTRLRRGRYLDPTPPEQRMEVIGETAYFVDGWTGHDAS